MRQCGHRYAIRAGRNFVTLPSFEGDRLCLHLLEDAFVVCLRREPAYCPSHRFATTRSYDRGVTGLEPHPEGFSRYRAIPRQAWQRASHGIARRLWPRLVRGSRCGLRRYERDCHTGLLPYGATIHPTRNFATLGNMFLHISMQVGLYLDRFTLPLAYSL